MDTIFNTAKSLLISAGILLVLLIVLSFVLAQGSRLPAPLGTAVDWAADHTRPEGWE
jgi:hypothetical protein